MLNFQNQGVIWRSVIMGTRVCIRINFLYFSYDFLMWDYRLAGLAGIKDNSAQKEDEVMISCFQLIKNVGCRVSNKKF